MDQGTPASVQTAQEPTSQALLKEQKKKVAREKVANSLTIKLRKEFDAENPGATDYIRDKIAKTCKGITCPLGLQAELAAMGFTTERMAELFVLE
jgi:hypothetical protein